MDDYGKSNLIIGNSHIAFGSIYYFDTIQIGNCKLNQNHWKDENWYEITNSDVCSPGFRNVKKIIMSNCSLDFYTGGAKQLTLYDSIPEVNLSNCNFLHTPVDAYDYSVWLFKAREVSGTTINYFNFNVSNCKLENCILSTHSTNTYCHTKLTAIGNTFKWNMSPDFEVNGDELIFSNNIIETSNTSLPICFSNNSANDTITDNLHTAIINNNIIHSASTLYFSQNTSSPVAEDAKTIIIMGNAIDNGVTNGAIPVVIHSNSNIINTNNINIL